MSDNLKFTWEVTFAQKQNGFTQDKLLKSFLSAAGELVARFAIEHNLTPVSSNLTAQREPAKKIR